MYATEVILKYKIKTIDDQHCSKQCQFFNIYRIYDGYCYLGKFYETLKSDKNKFLRTEFCKKNEATDGN
jgi:hypothetical protein